MLYLKATHLLFDFAWMAGLFYLPRIFVHYVEGQRAGEDVRRLVTMARKLYHFTTVMGVLALATGLGLWLHFGITGGWLHAKLVAVLGLVAYHLTARAFLKRVQRGAPMPGSTALRWYNEAPLVLLIAILYFVVLKPF